MTQSPTMPLRVSISPSMAEDSLVGGAGAVDYRKETKQTKESA